MALTIALILDFGRSILQFFDPRFVSVIARAIILSVTLLIGTALACAWLIGLLPSKIPLPLVGEVNVPLYAMQGMSFGLIIILSAFLMFPVAAMIVHLLLDEVADAVEARYYPGLPKLLPSHIIEMVYGALCFTMVVIIVNLGAMLFYLMAGPLFPVVFWGVNGYLMGREFFELVADRRLTPEEATDLRRRNGFQIWLVGSLLAIPLSFPLVSLVTPVLGVAVFTHVFHRLWAADRLSAQTGI